MIKAARIKISMKRETARKPVSGRINRMAAGRASNHPVKYAKWIKSTDEHEDRKGQSLATRSHDVIKRWAEERQAAPATLPGTEPVERPRILRFNFPGYSVQNLEKIDWNRWFKSFDNRKLVFRFQEHLKSGKQSNFFRLDNARQ